MENLNQSTDAAGLTQQCNPRLNPTSSRQEVWCTSLPSYEEPIVDGKFGKKYPEIKAEDVQSSLYRANGARHESGRTPSDHHHTRVIAAAKIICDRALMQQEASYP